jgi:hypothetical protein
MTTFDKELITEKRYADLCDRLKTATFPSSVLNKPYAIEKETRCIVAECQTRIRCGYPVDEGFLCTDCATVRLIRGLVEVIETMKNGETGFGSALLYLEAESKGEPGFIKVADVAEPPSPFSEVALPAQECTVFEIIPYVNDNPNLPADYVAKKELNEFQLADLSMQDLLTEVRGMLTPEMAGNPEKPIRTRTRDEYVQPTDRVEARSADFSKTGEGVVHIAAGGDKNLNVMNLPAGTILRFDSIKPVPVDRSPMAPGESPSPLDVGLLGNRSNDGMTIPEAVARKWEGPMRSKFAVDLSTIPEADRPYFEGYDTTPISLGSASDVRRYEQSMGDPALMAILEEEEDEFIAEQRRLFGDEHVDRMLGNKTLGISRSGDGAGTVRASQPAMTDEAKREASLGKQSAFPSLARRSHQP